MPKITDLYIYPIKSLGGIRVANVLLTDRGFQYDRRWMLVDENNNFLTQREYPGMALLQSAVVENGIRVAQKNNTDSSIVIPFEPATNERIMVNIWNDSCEATLVDIETDRWFSARLGLKCKLVYMADESHRKVDVRYAINEKDITNFSDAYPVLIIGQASLDDLNSRLTEHLPMNRFRPNIVFDGSEAYEEDRMEEFTINGIQFFGVKLCARCPIPTIDQDTGSKSKEPSKTLAIYRFANNNVYFGQNLLYNRTGSIKIGDEINITKRKSKPVFRQDDAG